MNAVGTATISRVRTDSLRDVLLLSSPGFVLGCRFPGSIRSRSGARATPLRAMCLWLCGHAQSRSSAAQRTAAGTPALGCVVAYAVSGHSIVLAASPPFRKNAKWSRC